MQFDLSDCSIVIPVCVDSMERCEHLQFLCVYFKKYFINCRLILAEVGKTRLIPLLTDREIETHFTEREKFSLTDISNWGASLVKTPFFCKCDADTLIHPKAIFDAFELLKNSPDQSFVRPFNGILFDVTNPLRKNILQTVDLSPLPFFTKEQIETPFTIPNMRLRVKNAYGLIHVFRTSTFKELGGYNEEFIEWGAEDNEIVNRFQTLGHPRVHLENYNAFHFDHPRKPVEAAQVFKNRLKMRELKDATEEELRRDIQRWSRFKN